MSDLISRQTAIEAITDERIVANMDSVYDSELHRCKRATHRILASLSSADAVPVVRCKDCKRRNTIDCGMQFYEYDDDMNLCMSVDFTQDNGFCYGGKSKDND